VTRPLILGTRGSALALTQSNFIRGELERLHGVRCELRTITTTGDVHLDTPLPVIGGKGVFTAELESALRDGTIDLAVHSLKDLPTAPVDGIVIGAIAGREDARDVLISRSRARLHELPAGAVVGTSSSRRAAQLRAARPDFRLRDIRGNVDTRLRKVEAGDYDAIVLAAAGLKRLGFEARATESLALEVMLPAPAQGALAVQCRADDPATLQLIAALDDACARRAVTAERAFLQALGGGCAAPVAAFAVDDGRQIEMRGLVAATDGSVVVRVHGHGSAPDALGEHLAAQAVQQGAAELLK
jgi:hydroxymethylbilane synthase